MADDVRDLMVRVDASVALLRAHLNGEGEQSLNRFEAAARKTAASVDRSIEEMGDRFGPFAEMAKSAAARAEESFEKSFSAIEKMAAKAIQAPAGRVDIGAGEARQAAQEAQQKATAYRLLEQAAIRAAAGEGELTQETRMTLAAHAAARIEAERHAAELTREAGALDRLEMEMQQAGAGAELLAQRQGQLTRISGSTRAGMQQLSYNLNDVAVQASLSTPPMQIFAMQFPQMIQAVQMMSGESKGLIGILGGSWGLAFTTALAVGAPVVAMLLQGNDALAKNIENLKKDAAETEINRRAKLIFQDTIEGVTAAIYDQREAVEKLVAEQRTAAEQANIDAKNEVGRIERIRTETAALLDKALAQQAVNDLVARAEYGAGGEVGKSIAQAEIDRLQKLKADNDESLRIAKETLSLSRTALGAEQAKRAAETMATPEGRIQRAYEVAVEAAQRKYKAEMATTAELGKQQQLSRQLATDLLRLQNERDKKIKRVQAEAAQRRADESATRNGTLTPGAVGSMLTNQFGGTVTSTTGGKHAKNSYHYRSQAVDFVPEGGMGSITKAQLRAYLEAQGVKIQELLGPGDKGHGNHFHIAFAKQARSQEAMRKQAEAAQAAILADQISFASEERQARRRLIEAQKRSAETDEQRTQLALEDIESEYAAQKTKIAAQQQRGDLSQAEADRLNQLNRETAMQRSRNVQAERAVRLIEAGYEAEAQSLEGQLAELRIQADMAVSLKERRKIASEMLAIEQEMRRRALERVRDTSQDPQEVARAMSALQQLPAIQALERQRSEQQNQGAWSNWMRDMRADATDYADVLEGEAVDAARQLKNELAEAAIRGANLGDILENAVDRFLVKLAELAIDQAFLALTSQFGSGGGGVSASGTKNGNVKSASSAAKNSFGGARANGGDVSPGSWYMVGERGPEPFIPRVPGTILPNSALRGGGQPVAIELHLDEGALFEPRVRSISSGVTVSIAKKGTRKASLDSRQSLEGR